MATKKWVSDSAHSELEFKVKHLMVSNVTGRFGEFQVTAETEAADFQDAKVTVIIQTESITTGPADRDTHLRSADFFEAEKFPEIKFVSSRLRKMNEEGDYELDGELTLKGVTKPVKLRAEYGGTVRDPWGNVRAAFSIQGKISRKEWNLSWNAALETGGVMVSDEVRILAEVQMVEKEEETAKA